MPGACLGPRDVGGLDGLSVGSDRGCLVRLSVVRSVVLFVGLAAVAAALVVAAGAVGEGFERAALLAFGGAMFGAALAVFLIGLIFSPSAGQAPAGREVPR